MTPAFQTEQSKHDFEVARGTYAEHGASKRVLPNVHSIEKTLPDQGFYEVGGDGFEPPTPAL